MPVPSKGLGSAPYRTQTELLDALKASNLTVLTGRNGRTWSLENYTNMLVRSQSLTAYNTAAANTLLKAGRRFAKIPKLRPDIDGPDICNRWEEAVYIDLTKPEQVPPYHPNCRHAPQPVSFAELEERRPDLYRLAVAHFEGVANP